MNYTTRETILWGTVGVVCCVMVLTLIVAWNYSTEHALSICSRCGERVVTETSYYSWSTRPAGEIDRIVLSRPTILSELWNTSGTCRHGGFAGIVNGKLDGPQAGNYLILIESYTDTPLGRYGPYGHGTGIGHGVYGCYYQPGDSITAQYSEFDFAGFRDFLLKKKMVDSQFPKRFRNLMQTVHPSDNTLAKDLVNEFEKTRDPHSN